MTARFSQAVLHTDQDTTIDRTVLRAMRGQNGRQLSHAVVVGMLIASSAMMAMAWLGHLRFQDEWSFWTALTVSWLIVLPEYVLNTTATRAGYGIMSGAQMASIHLSSGVICVALVSHIVLSEPLTLRMLIGFATMFVAIVLIIGGDLRLESEKKENL